MWILVERLGRERPLVRLFELHVRCGEADDVVPERRVEVDDVVDLILTCEGVDADELHDLAVLLLVLAVMVGCFDYVADLDEVDARAEAYWNLRTSWRRAAEIDIDPFDDRLAGQLGAIKWKLDSKGRVRIESKEEMRKRGVPSRDRADGVMMVFATECRSPDIDVEAHRGESIIGDLMTRAWWTTKSGGGSGGPPVRSPIVSNQSPVLRFGITCDGKRSSYWRVRAGMAKPELFLEHEGFGKVWHISLHVSGEWHMVTRRKERATWDRPGELFPGYTRAVGIVQPVAVAHREGPEPADVQLVSVAPDADPTTFSLFIERPGANQATWPGKNAEGTTFVGRIPLAADAGTCCFVALQHPLEPGKVELRPSDDELRQMRNWAANGVLVTTVVGELSDGAIGLIDLRADPSVVATIDSALGS
jgi:hypothetical protein